MRVKITSNRANVIRIDSVRQRVRTLLPATRRVGEFITREARRRAPRGTVGNRMSGLAASLNHVEPSDRVTVLQSPKPYARIQHYGGAVAPVRARALAVPLNDDAEIISQSLGPKRSLRSLPHTFLVKIGGRAFIAVNRHQINRSGKQKIGETFKIRKSFAVWTGGTPTDKPQQWRAQPKLKPRTSNTQARLRAAAPKPDDGVVEFLFVLVPRVDILARPYAPSVAEPPIRHRIAKIITNYLTGGLPR